MLQPDITQQGIVAPLIEEQLSIVFQTGVDFAILVKIGCIMPTAVLVVQEQDVTFSDVDEEADVATAALSRESRLVQAAIPGGISDA